jgi:hypothetical protein
VTLNTILFANLPIFVSFAAAMQMLFFSVWHLPDHLQPIFWKDIIHEIVIYTQPIFSLLNFCISFVNNVAFFYFLGSTKEWCFMCELEKVLTEGKPGILSHLNEIGTSFGQGREEDAHEFLR